MITLMNESKTAPWGLLVMRIGTGALMLTHGIPKLLQFQDMIGRFPSVFGLSPTVSLALTIFAEVVCSITLIVGFFPRLSALFGLITMLVAALLIHGGDPLAKREMALLYSVLYFGIASCGGGKFTMREG